MYTYIYITYTPMYKYHTYSYMYRIYGRRGVQTYWVYIHPVENNPRIPQMLLR